MSTRQAAIDANFSFMAQNSCKATAVTEVGCLQETDTDVIVNSTTLDWLIRIGDGNRGEPPELDVSAEQMHGEELRAAEL